MRLRIGTSGYSYPGAPPKGWHGLFYPKTRGKGFDELGYYSSFFDAVEINSTFYRPATPALAEAWAKKTPPDFEFAIKAWQKFTHPMKLGVDVGPAREKWAAPDDADAELFKKGIGPLADSGKLGALLFQYPPSFHGTKENRQRLRRTLEDFGGYPKAVELRHKSWSDQKEETKALLEQAGATWTVIDEPKFAASVAQEIEPVGGMLYLRLHGRNREKWWRHNEPWERYDYLYGPEEIRFFADRIREVAESSSQTKIQVFFNNHARGQAVANGWMLRHELGQVVDAVLSAAMLEAYPQLAGVVRVGNAGGLFGSERL